MLALLLMVPGLGCAVYGGLVRLEQIAPPILNVVVGPAHLIGGVSPTRCEPEPHCTRAYMAGRPRPTYRAWLFIDIADTHIIQLARITFSVP
jgi:hypothetical protein